MRVLHVIDSLNAGGAEKFLINALPSYIEKGLQMDIFLLNGEETPFFKKYDLIHVHLFPAFYFVAIAKIISFSKVPLLFTEHNIFNRHRTNFWIKRFDKYVYFFYIKIVVITDEIKTILEKYTNLENQRFRVIENGINTELFFDAIKLKKIRLLKHFQRKTCY